MNTKIQNQKYAMLNRAHWLYKQSKKCESFDVYDFENSINYFHLSLNSHKDHTAKKRILNLAKRNALGKIVSSLDSISDDKSELRDYALQTLIITGGFD